MISLNKGLLVHLRDDTYCRDGIEFEYNELGLQNLVFSYEDNIFNNTTLANISRKISSYTPKVIVIRDAKSVIPLAEVIAQLSPNSLKYIDDSAYANQGIHLEKIPGSYQKLRQLNFQIVSFGYDSPLVNAKILERIKSN